MAEYIMAFDAGTTSSRCILFDRQGTIRSAAQKEFTQLFPRPGWVEHDAREIWATQLGVAVEAMGKIGASARDIAGIGITNQRETTVVWDKATGEPVCNAIVWQCRRTSAYCDQLKASGYDAELRRRTGLVADAYFSGPKIKWILDNVPGARARAERGELLFGTVDSWLIWNLTHGAAHVTDYTNASRTMLFDIHKKCWDSEILDYFRIPRAMLPQVRPSSCVYGDTAPDVTGGRIPIAGAAGDQQAALFGQCCFAPGDVKNTYGTGCFLLMNTGEKAVRSRHGLLTTIAATAGAQTQYALEGSVFVAGAAVQWLRDQMQLVRTSSQTQAVCTCVPGTGGVYVVPAFAGLGAPYWNPYARGTIVGISRGTTREHIIRATVESMAYQVYDLIEAMEQDSGLELRQLKVDGGASANDFLMQFQADLLRSQLHRPQCIETTALGAAYLAGIAVGCWRDEEEVRQNWQTSRQFLPNLPERQRQELVRGWKRAVRCALAWAQDP